MLLAFQMLLPAAITVAMMVLFVHVFDVPLDNMYISLAAVAAALALLMLRPRRLGTAQLAVDGTTLTFSILGRWAMFVGLMLAIGYLTKSSGYYSRKLIVAWAATTPLALILVEVLLYQLRRSLSVAGLDRRHAVIAGCNEASQALYAQIRQHPELKIVCSGFFDDRSPDRLSIPQGSTLLGSLPELAPHVKAHGIDIVFIALPMRHIQRVVDLLHDIRDTTASIYYVPDIFVYDLIQARTGDVAGVPVVSMCETPFYGFRGVTKRMTDLVIAALALVALSPLMGLIALMIKATSAGPVLFTQKRYGLDGQLIRVYKFRTMTVAEDGDRVLQAKRDDNRVTRLGRVLRKTSLDELPQLINVLQGSMSLVGPRPHAVAHNEEYRRLISGYMIRHKVLPGMTGLAQINGCRGETARLEDMRERVKYDLDYLRKWSLVLDLEILWRTFLMLFRRDDKAY
jgi:putative colanic acid biosysnthesis UDP-glucose lipid carrier transferase